jgi:two-component system, chemotaxis family, chemotaxis protein CheY
MTTILIIDDSQLARHMVSNMVRDARPDWFIVAAKNADDALEKVEEVVPDVAIVDYNMPGMDGLTLSCELHARFPLLDISILTANVQDSTRRKVTEKGFRFVEKPITPDKMRELLADLP